MRSEKEIKEKKVACKNEFMVAVKTPDNSKTARLYGWIDALRWTLEGEPRYSVAELEKIWGHLINSEKTSYREFKKIFTNSEWDRIPDFFKFLKDKKKVEMILDVNP